MVYNMKVRDHLLAGRFDVDVLQNAIFIFLDLFQVHIVSHICRFSEPAFTIFMHIVALRYWRNWSFLYLKIVDLVCLIFFQTLLRYFK